MNNVTDLLRERRAEYVCHTQIVAFLEARAGPQRGLPASQTIERRHVAISKAGLLVHLYNIVEAIMTGTLKEVMRTAADFEPVHYDIKMLSEWTRQTAGTHTYMSEDTRLTKTLELGSILIERRKCTPAPPPKASGSWDDIKIGNVAKRLGCRLNVPTAVRKAARSPYFNDKSRMYYVMKRRNDLAHGTMTFEDGGREKTLEELDEIANATLDYLEAVVTSFERFLSAREFLRADAR